jgi:hypothetical protein
LPHIRAFIRDLIEDTRLMLRFFGELCRTARPHAASALRAAWKSVRGAARYALTLGSRWPEVRKWYRSHEEKARKALGNAKEFRRYVPIARARATETLLFLKGKTLFAYRYVAAFREHWPEIKKETLMYAEELKRLRHSSYFAAAAYIPFVGWLIPLYLKRDDPLCQEHGKTGFLCAIVFTGAALSLFFLDLLFVPRDWRIVRLVVACAVYIVYAVYFPLCLRGIYTALQQKKLEIRTMEKYIKRIEL